MTSTPKPSEAQKQILKAALDIRMNDPGPADAAFLARQLVLATLPHRNPKGSPPIWSRRNGNYTLAIQPGYKTDPETKDQVCLGYPYGTIPRLLLFWVTTEALRTQSSRLTLGQSLAEFMRKIGLNPARGGKRGDYRRLEIQMERTFRAKFTFEASVGDDRLGGNRWSDLQVAEDGEWWWSINDSEQGTLFENWIELSPKFYRAIMAAPVPVDVRALRALKRSPLALDLYAWLSYKTYTINKRGGDQFVPWRSMQEQFGADYSDPKNFKKAAKAALRKVRTVSRFQLEEEDGGLRIKHGELSIPARPAQRKISSPTR